MLYLVATPIGNLADLSERAIKTLSEVDFIAAEDTRNTLRLLSGLGISKTLISYHEHNRHEAGERIAARLEAGESCALVTDAGTPAISDPGEDIVALCAQRGIPVTSIPGACAFVTALTLSGLPTRRFVFEGFLPPKGKERRERLSALAREERTFILHEAPHKLMRTLEDMYKYFGDREIALCRELTKMHEEIIRTTLSQAIAKYTETPPKGEFVLVLAGAEHIEEETITLEDAVELVLQRRENGERMKDAVRQVSADTGINKNELYDAALKAGQ